MQQSNFFQLSARISGGNTAVKNMYVRMVQSYLDILDDDVKKLDFDLRWCDVTQEGYLLVTENLKQTEELFSYDKLTDTVREQEFVLALKNILDKDEE